jgi:hypothetical protein
MIRKRIRSIEEKNGISGIMIVLLFVLTMPALRFTIVVNRTLPLQSSLISWYLGKCIHPVHPSQHSPRSSSRDESEKQQNHVQNSTKGTEQKEEKKKDHPEKKSDVIQYSPSSKKKATIKTRKSSDSLSTKHRDEVPSGSGNISQNNPAKDEFELKDKFDASETSSYDDELIEGILAASTQNATPPEESGDISVNSPISSNVTPQSLIPRTQVPGSFAVPDPGIDEVPEETQNENHYPQLGRVEEGVSIPDATPNVYVVAHLVDPEEDNQSLIAQLRRARRERDQAERQLANAPLTQLAVIAC